MHEVTEIIPLIIPRPLVKTSNLYRTLATILIDYRNEILIVLLKSVYKGA